MSLPKTGPSYDLAVAMLLPALRILTRREWSGTEHIPREGGVIVAANHLSYFDPLALAHFLHAQGRAVRFLAKEALFDAPVFGHLLRSAGQIPVRRGSRHAGNALAAAEDAVRRGECVVIYPEGTITRDPALWPMAGKTGLVRVALATGCAIVPVAQWGAQEVLAPYARVPRLLPRKTMRISAGPAIDLTAYRGAEPTPALLKSIASSVMHAITDLLAMLRSADPPSVPFDPRTRNLPSTGNFRRRARERLRRVRATERPGPGAP